MTNNKKKILLTIGRSMIVRNLLQNDFFKLLREKYQLIILTPAARDQRFCLEFAHPNVSFEWFTEESHGAADIVWLGLHKYLIWSKFIALKLRYGTRALTKPEDLSLTRFLLFSLIFRPLSRLVWLRDLARWSDLYLGQRRPVKRLRELLRQQAPALVISTSISSNGEAALIKAAKREGIWSVGMPKSWDNLSRAGFRAKADFLVVWNQFMADQATSLQRYRSDQIKIIGIPQFDNYYTGEFIWSREQFCRQLNIDPKRKIVLFTSEGKSVPEDADIAWLLAEFIEKGDLPNSVLLIRPHFSYRRDEEKFTCLQARPKVALDRVNNPSAGFKDTGDFSLEAMARFANSLYHAAVVVNVASTITLDAAAFDRPIVNVAFEPRINVPPQDQALALSYESDYFLEIVKTKGTKVVRSRGEFLSALQDYLNQPTLDTTGRARLRQRFVGPFDGNAGRRFAHLVGELIK